VIFASTSDESLLRELTPRLNAILPESAELRVTILARLLWSLLDESSNLAGDAAETQDQLKGEEGKRARMHA
jgi:hypothetical protein